MSDAPTPPDVPTDRPRCRCCRERFEPNTSDACDPDDYCSAGCEDGELG